jgi:hypothetical protein
MNIDEDQLSVWAEGPGQTEQDQCDNAVAAVKKAIAGSESLSGYDIEVFPQGSYRVRTNVKQNSDVDVAVCLRSIFFPDYPLGKGKEDYGNVDSEISFAGFKDLVEESLVDYFGRNSVVRGNKAFDIHENSYRVDADVVPTFSRRRYNSNGLDDWIMPEGIGFIPDDKGFVVENWPEQTYSNGVDKNAATSRSYKAIIRIIKRLRDQMQEDGVDAAKDVASFLIESLIWNVPNEGFTHDSYTDDLRYVLAHVFNNTAKDETCSEWGEVNELKYLFRGSQPWSREQANKFTDAAWNYVRFK